MGAERDITLRIAVEGADAERTIDRLRDRLGGAEGGRGGARGRGGPPIPGAPRPGSGGRGGGGGGAVVANNTRQLGKILKLLAIVVTAAKITGPQRDAATYELDRKIRRFHRWNNPTSLFQNGEELGIQTRANESLEERMKQIGRESMGLMSDESMRQMAEHLRGMHEMMARGEAQGQRIADEVNPGVLSRTKIGQLGR